MKHSSSFRFLWLGQSFANLGDVLYIVALITLIYQLTGSATYMALITKQQAFEPSVAIYYCMGDVIY
ncbi:hypothetical protein RYX56_01410 [Alkalihalophilus lindianensis]|uniref:Uncharacterized protein n=1 Tax=Alkalihalophilus lindianensis TaxID=1630542 RepID=A0ABU3X567_9BACI|nr:hypothetical protein [Alkalihalophilus lindianensis]MDV2683025.1 hypothetical protein [Alkalihalophilus lindianensis]